MLYRCWSTLVEAEEGAGKEEGGKGGEGEGGEGEGGEGGGRRKREGEEDTRAL